MSIYAKFDEYFKNKDLATVLTEAEKYFVKIDECAKLMRTTQSDNFSVLNDILVKVGGYRAYLEPVLGLAMTYKKGNEMLEFDELAKAQIAKNEKVVAAQLEKAASLKVQDERKVRNIFQSYINSCEAIVRSIQSRLKSDQKIQAD
jgi:hypothetical protein